MDHHTHQPDLFDLRTPEGLRAALSALTTVLSRYKAWTTCGELRHSLPWLTPQRLSRLLEISEGQISSTNKGYLLTARLTPAQNREAHAYLSNRITKQQSRMIARNLCWHRTGHHATTTSS